MKTDCSLTAFIADGKVCIYSTGKKEYIIHLIADIIVSFNDECGVDVDEFLTKLKQRIGYLMCGKR